MTAPLIGLVGAKRAGKDTFAERLVAAHGFRRLAFADRLKHVALDTDPIVATPDYGGSVVQVRLSRVVKRDGWEKAKEIPEVRIYLQRLGTAVRDSLGLSAWIDPVLEEAERFRLPGLGSLGEDAPGTPVVITDVRFPNEVERVLRAGGRIVKIARPGQRPDDPHPSEALAWDDSFVPWRLVANDSSIARLSDAADVIAGEAW